MIRGIYNSSSAMQYLEDKLDVVANNLANANTTGFKKQGVAFNQRLVAEQAKHLDKITIDPLPAGEVKTYIETTQGALKQTNNPLNFALDGEGYFTVMTHDGIAYTRDGSFTMDDDGYLTTIDGYAVLGEYNSPIRPFDKHFSVGDTGEVVVDNTVVNKFLITDFDTSEVIQRGKNLYFPKDFSTQEFREPSAFVRQGFLEDSNVEIVKEMIQMIAINRQYQAQDKAIKTNDEALNKAVNNIAR